MERNYQITAISIVSIGGVAMWHMPISMRAVMEGDEESFSLRVIWDSKDLGGGDREERFTTTGVKKGAGFNETRITFDVIINSRTRMRLYTDTPTPVE